MKITLFIWISWPWSAKPMQLICTLSATNGNLVLGSERFQRQISDALKLRIWRGKAGRPKNNG